MAFIVIASADDGVYKEEFSADRTLFTITHDGVLFLKDHCCFKRRKSFYHQWQLPGKPRRVLEGKAREPYYMAKIPWTNLSYVSKVKAMATTEAGLILDDEVFVFVEKNKRSAL